ncbi:MAG: long-chain fatty acid--CoA ligase [Thermoanaerobaculia bacterium]
MRGLMQHDPLVVNRILERAVTLFPRQEIVTWTKEGVHRETFAEFGGRVGRLASALASLGVRPGDRVATFAFNTFRHQELYFAVPCMGAVLHTLNIRLHADQTAWIANHAGDHVVFVDAPLLPAFAPLVSRIPSAKHVVVMGEADRSVLPSSRDYERLLEGAAPDFPWPELDEDDAAAMCYTSGTTGHPKGVVYSHRSTVLHATMVNLASCLGLTDRDAVLPVVPMFHANAWGLPYAALMAGSKLVLAGAASADPAALVGLIQGERVTVAAGVPTVWTGLLHYLEKARHDLSSLRLVTVGGSAVSTSMIERFKGLAGVDAVQGWGMTETGPVASLSFPTAEMEGLPESEQVRMRSRQGRVVPGIRFRVVSPDGRVAPWDDQTKGELEVKGNWVAESYFSDEESAERFHEGWLRTGDIAVVDAHGSIRIVDRAKDLVKSGGEWISSVDLELELVGHPSVLEAAVIGVPDPTWDERPLACVVVKPGKQVTRDELHEFLASRVPKWWLPDEIVFLAELPKTGVGKLDKKVLRQRYRDQRPNTP